MRDEIAKETSELLAVAKQVAKKEFGEDFVAAHPEVIVTMFQGIATIAQAKAMERLENTIGAAVGELAHR
jgi:hypothetical protein